MTEFFTITTSLPTAPFAAAMLLSVAYWGVTLLAGLDVGTEAVEGSVDAALDAAADGLDLAADAVDAAASSGHGSLLADLTGIGTVPITIWFSMFSLWGWLTSFVTTWALRNPLAGTVPPGVGAVLAFALATVAGVVLAGRSSRPLAPVFQANSGRRRSELQGEVAEITTSRVDGRFGQARLQLGGDDLVIQVRNDRADNGLRRGQPALVVGFDPKREAYVVEPTGERPRAAARNSVREG